MFKKSNKKPKTLAQQVSRQSLVIKLLSITTGLLLVCAVIVGVTLSCVWKAQQAEAGANMSPFFLTTATINTFVSMVLVYQTKELPIGSSGV